MKVAGSVQTVQYPILHLNCLRNPTGDRGSREGRDVAGLGGCGKIAGMAVAFETDRNLCGAAEAAKIYGCSMSRIRQLAKKGVIWSKTLGRRSKVYDADQIRKLAKDTHGRRAAGKLAGKPPAGFVAD